MSSTNRRKFLEQSLLATATGLAASLAPRHAIAQRKGRRSANEVIRVATIGVNGRGGSHVSGFKSLPNVEVAAICDCDEAVGRKKIAALEKSVDYKVKFYQDIRDLLNDETIDCVSVATPNHWHALAAIWAIQHGKHVYVEKPVSHNVSEGRRIVQAARKYDRCVQTGTQSRSTQGTVDAIEFMHGGGIGEVNLARGLCYKRRKSIGKVGNYDVPASVDYNLWLGPAPDKSLNRERFHYDWHWQWDYGNGDLGNQGIHQMDIARWGLDVDNIGDGIVSYGGRFGYVDSGQTANTQVSIHSMGDKKLVFEVRGLAGEGMKSVDWNGRVVSFDLPKENKKTENGVTVGNIFYGSEGFLVCTSGYSHTFALNRDGKVIKEFSGGGDHFENFINAVRANDHTKLNADIEQGHLSSALCHLGNVSYRLGEEVSFAEAKDRLPNNDEARETFERFTAHLEQNGLTTAATKLNFGRNLKLDGRNEVFVGDAEANSMLTREYREPFVVPSAEDV